MTSDLKMHKRQMVMKKVNHLRQTKDFPFVFGTNAYLVHTCSRSIVSSAPSAPSAPLASSDSTSLNQTSSPFDTLLKLLPNGLMSNLIICFYSF